MFPETNLEEQRKNVRKFSEKVVYFNYDVKDKLSPRSYEGRIMGHTECSRKLEPLKGPRPVTEDEGEDPLGEKAASELDDTSLTTPNNQYNHLRPQRKKTTYRRRMGRNSRKTVL